MASLRLSVSDGSLSLLRSVAFFRKPNRDEKKKEGNMTKRTRREDFLPIIFRIQNVRVV